MGDANLNAAKHSGTTKPRLSLLSSKQSGLRLKSEDLPDQQITILSSNTDDCIDIVTTNPLEQKEYIAHRDLEQRSLKETERATQKFNGNTQSDENKMNEDLIRLLSMLKSELQSKEIALAAIKCEQLKRLINPVEISRSSLASTYIELQDRLKTLDQNNNHSKNPGAPTSASNDQRHECNLEATTKQTHDYDSDENDRENLNILNTLLELLDRHPQLALPRDSIYCLDYNCNELSTKNYLNLKIQNLDNLINQHRRYRYYMNERLKKSEQRYIDVVRELELERSSKFENEKSIYRDGGKAMFIKQIEQLQAEIEKEKQNKQAIVMTLLNELLDERKTSQILASKLAEREADSVEKNAGEREKLLMLETEFNNLNIQLKKQSMVFTKERTELQARIADLEAKNLKLLNRIDQSDARQSTSTKPIMSNSDTKESSPINRTSVGSRQPNQTMKNLSNSSSPTAVARGSIGAAATKSIPSNKMSQNSNAPAQGFQNRVVLTQSASSNGSLQPSPVSRQSSAGSSSNQRPPAAPVVSRVGSSTTNTEQAAVRIQPQFKSASVLSTNQQVRNLKGSPSSTGSVIHNPPLTRSSTNNQPITKPQVPAKPAQLLDQQRNLFN